MPTPSNRTPIRVARGTTSNLNSSISDIQEGEIVFSTDDNKLLVKEGSSLTDTQANVAAKANVASPTFTGTVTIPAGASIADIGTTIQAYDADTAKTDVAQTYTAGQRAEVTTLTSSSGSVAIDFSASNNFKLTLSEAVTAITASNATAGQSGSIFIEQPSSGGPYAVGGWVAAFLFSGAAAPTITQTASKCDRVDYTILSATQIQVVWTGNY
ncbi:hypothetical protein HOQ49_gp07 [uncultured phage_MedDCM-OCT-S37-C6]|uniref:Major tropism determinant N-terminal domain-containing protein n=1 Tax=uncultured phage_MedDCM-OCT-S37-C6 TaxID=2740804 RepID=A0A6S4PM50_9CAUD|nr:hypothetical protein HOQ49_gp07 [uncultured phage_MedDCM-OCT-S37-C6]BAQ94344.1 hypothetical protein [uncultured phage_MedDCM-OCT-S37-C6]